MGTEAPYLSGMFRFVARLHTLSKRGMRMALAGQPKCRYGMLQSLYNLIEQHGRDGAIYVSDIARQMHQPMPAISRGLRQMEQRRRPGDVLLPGHGQKVFQNTQFHRSASFPAILPERAKAGKREMLFMNNFG